MADSEQGEVMVGGWVKGINPVVRLVERRVVSGEVLMLIHPGGHVLKFLSGDRTSCQTSGTM